MKRYGRKFFRYSAARLWNSLPETLRQCSSYNQLKSLLNRWGGPLVTTEPYIFSENFTSCFSPFYWSACQTNYQQQRHFSHDNSQLCKNLQECYSFLQSMYSTQKHGLLSIESGCRKFCQTYRSMEDPEKLTLLCHIAENYGVDQDIIVSTVQKFLDSKVRGEVVMLRQEDRMRDVLSAKYNILFSDIGRIEGGVKFLVDMRADILRLISSTSDINRAHLTDLQHALRDLLSLWFTAGFLNLERVTWHSSCDMLEKISEYEAVHPVRHWQDLKRRVGMYRRCFVFTHSSMPREPIVVLHCALTNEISSSIHSIIGHRSFSSGSVEPEPFSDGPEDPGKITTAMFYSISSSQQGLQGVDLGNYLIKKVAGHLQQEWPQMTQFSSISPIPGLRDWLIREINSACSNLKDESSESAESKPQLIGQASCVLTDTEIKGLCDIAKVSVCCKSALKIFREHITQHTWVKDQQLVGVMKGPLMRLCARYLYLEKRRGYALNSVGNFHLQNGAVLWRVNYLADTTLRGLNNSCGLMVNYRYYLEDTITNSQQYIENQIITASLQVLELLGQINMEKS